MSRVLVIGAGASGLMAALTAARNNADVTVLEHKSEAGIKLALTGNGRCNYTNTDAAADKYHGDEGAKAFAAKVLEHFGSEDTVRFFRELGIEPIIRHYAYDESGYVYPKDMNAVSFRDILLKAALDAGVKIYYGVEPDTLWNAVRTVVGAGVGEGFGCIASGKVGCDKVGNAVFDVRDSRLKTSINDDSSYRGEVKFDSVIIATGSNAYPVTGSDSSIYPLLKEAGIEMHRFLPALCALFSKDEYLKVMKGRRVKTKAELKIYSGSDEEKFEEQLCSETYSCSGEIQFNEHSISGIPVMQLSRYAAIALSRGDKVVLSIDAHDYAVHRTAGFDRAQTCSGGVPTADIDPDTMRYKDSNIYICGELIDVDGDCGGYNLQFAWSTGYIAGNEVSGRQIAAY